MTQSRRRSGFGMVELLVVLFVIAFCCSLVSSQIFQNREVANRIKCASNLRQIGQGLLLYSNENRGNFPRTIYKPDAGKWTAYTGWKSAEPFEEKDKEGNAGPDANDVTAPVFLLIRTQELPAESLVCPSAKGARQWDFASELKVRGAAPTAQDRSNFPSPEFLTYSYMNPYPDKAAIAKGYKVNSTIGAEFAAAADMNPGGDALPKLTVNSPAKEMAGGNSPNHDGAGQNILFGDGHVEFNTSAFAGMKRDNIYTVSGATDGTTETSKDVWGSPRWAGASVLLPTAQEKGDEKASALSKAVAPPRGSFWGTTTRPVGGATTRPAGATTRPSGGGPTTRPALRPIGR